MTGGQLCRQLDNLAASRQLTNGQIYGRTEGGKVAPAVTAATGAAAMATAAATEAHASHGENNKHSGGRHYEQQRDRSCLMYHPQRDEHTSMGPPKPFRASRHARLLLSEHAAYSRTKT
eukprot:GHVU01117844.1.p1 GENE.GHVU01117844.1~~GHVU01117844.1.p1  ORF type:complete len:119 (-),score=11.73 GHVU01117844.1:209-565(-)